MVEYASSVAGHTRYMSFSCSCIKTVIVSSARNIRSSAASCSLSRNAVHLPIPPLTANLVHLPKSVASIVQFSLPHGCQCQMTERVGDGVVVEVAVVEEVEEDAA